MKKLYLINFSLMEKIGDKKNGTVEDATSFITCTEIFFALLAIEFIIIAIIPVKVSPYFLGGVSIAIWFFTNYMLRKSLKTKIVQSGIRQQFKQLPKTTAKTYLGLSILLFFMNFFLFFAITVWTLGGYYK